MSDILIRGMEMPKDGVYWCEISIAGDIAIITIHGENRKSFPISQLPEGHGALIDLDNVLLDIDCTGTNKFGMLDEDIRAFLRRYKPIVPAEGTESE